MVLVPLLLACRSPTPPPDVAAAPVARALDPDGVEALKAALDERVTSGGCPGYVAVLARDGVVHETLTGGVADVASGRPMTAATPVRIASMTKPVTAVAVLQLAERGLLRLDQPAHDFVPELAEARVATAWNRDGHGALPTVALARPITIRDLLTHTAGFGYDFGPPSDLLTMNIEADLVARPLTLEAMSQELATIPLYRQPGERWQYSWANDVLGRVVEVSAGRPFAEVLETQVFGPLGMTATSFLGPEPPAGLATLYTHDASGILVPTDDTLTPL
ncbi:MAG: serine hydrolase domain-containing protein, partial [Myxococcota bacterium]